jgi:hypothetical protein
MNKLNAAKRIDALEHSTSHESDAEILAWGAAVSDAELLAVAAMPQCHIADALPSTKPAGAMSDAVLFRFIKPSVEAWRRAGGNVAQAPS